MASINYAAREISVKIVFYGPGLSGKTTNLQVIHRKIPQEYRSDMVSLATETDRTLFFDFLPLDLGKIKGFTTKFQLYTVPGQVYYNATRKLVLRGVDGVVFVADSAPDKMQENLESFQNLEENLVEYGYQRENIPIIIQYNKRDLPNALSIEEMQRALNKYNLPWSESVASRGKGVFESLKLIGKIVLDYLNKKYSRHDTAMPAHPAPAPAPMASPRAETPQPQPRPIAPAPVAQPRPQQQQQRQFTAPAPAAKAPEFPAFGEATFEAAPPKPAVKASAGSDPFLRPSSAARPAAPAAPRAPQQSPPKPATPQQQPDYMDYGVVNLESMDQSAKAPAKSFSAPQPQGGQWGVSKSNQDLEIESYRQEIIQKQRGQAGPSPAPARSMDEEPTFEIKTPSRPQAQQRPAAQPMPQQPFAQPGFQAQKPAQPFAQPSYQQPAPPQQRQQFSQPQQGFQQHPGQPQKPQAAQQQQQQQQPFTGNTTGSERDYNSVYNVEPPPSNVQPHTPGFQAPQPGEEGNSEEPLYFTSVDTDRAKKGKKPVNPKMKQSKGFFGKLFNRENS